MRLYFFRHGETVEGAEGIILWSLPGKLSEKGRTDTEMLAQTLKSSGFEFDRIVSSDLFRAVETSKILTDRLGVETSIDSSVRERNAGAAEGKTEDEIDWAPYETKPFAYRKHKGGESFFDVKKRAQAFLAALPAESGENVIVVSHSVFIGMVVAAANGLSMKRAVKIKPEAGTPVYDTKSGKVLFVKLD